MASDHTFFVLPAHFEAWKLHAKIGRVFAIGMLHLLVSFNLTTFAH